MSTRFRIVRFRISRPGLRGSVSGVVQGSGGFVSSIARMRSLISRATRGVPHGAYEPMPGCVLMYSKYSTSNNGPGRVVSIKNAKVSIARARRVTKKGRRR